MKSYILVRTGRMQKVKDFKPNQPFFADDLYWYSLGPDVARAVAGYWDEKGNSPAKMFDPDQEVEIIEEQLDPRNLDE